jgi:uncharacterized MAPEG superfamily protein
VNTVNAHSITIAHWIVFVGGVMPYFIVLLAKATRTYDNADPRNAANFADPLRHRAHGAHLNALEAFAFFAIGVLLATLNGADPTFIDTVAVLWLVLRCLYLWSYLTNRATLRSILWFAASFAAIAIYLAALLR